MQDTRAGRQPCWKGKEEPWVPWNWLSLPKCIWQQECMTLSLGSDLRHVGDVSELAIHHLRVNFLLGRLLGAQWRVYMPQNSEINRGHVKRQWRNRIHLPWSKCCGWRDPTRTSRTWSEEKNRLLSIWQAQRLQSHLTSNKTQSRTNVIK